ncbi:transposase [Microaerobacter geothermalis]|uniref:transposase n=1 Tax=Microaerobacter geothermalis TaxID=674972 RepID=UPI001F40B2A3|nr:transposase [Microaerobacter geothermalis]MCF6095029.1 transposase [Microaerobacter geothermalis]
MENKNTGKKFNDDFKRTVVDLYHSGSSVKDLSSEYGVSEVTIYKWIKAYTPVEGVEGKSITPKEVSELKKRILSLSRSLKF